MKFRTNNFYVMAMKYLEDPRPIEDREIAKEDITSLFLYELEQMVINREHINININGKVRQGKSTIAMFLGWYIQGLLVKHKRTTREFSIFNIARTQYEMSRKILSPELDNVVIVIDENDDLEDSGENSTVEQKMLQSFSKVQAVRYIHRIYCSPSDQPDSESDLIIHVIQPDKATKITHCRLYYRASKPTTKLIQLIGHINIGVGDIIENWIKHNLEAIYFEKQMNPESAEKLAYWQRKDWYVDYQVRKKEKVDLMTKYGVFRVKDLDFADVTFEAIMDLKGLAKLQPVTKQQIKNHIKTICRKFQIPTSMVGDEMFSQRAEGILSYFTSYHEYCKKIEILAFQMRGGKITEDQYNEKRRELEGAVRSIESALNSQVQEVIFLLDLKKKYYGEILTKYNPKECLSFDKSGNVIIQNGVKK